MFVAALTFLLFVGLEAKPQWGSGEQSWDKNTKFENADDKYEMISHEVLESTDDFELRRYPASKWVCMAMKDFDPSTDAMKDWQSKYGNPMQAMSAKSWKETPSSKMFMKLFRYIVGVNMKQEEIEMTRPVTTKVVESDEKSTVDMDMCFWLGTPYQSKEAPNPIDKKIYIQERPEMVVFVKEFGGFAMSHQDWEEKYDDLKNSLEDGVYEEKVWYHIGYDSPFTPGDQRRNEIWIPKSEIK